MPAASPQNAEISYNANPTRTSRRRNGSYRRQVRESWRCVQKPSRKNRNWQEGETSLLRDLRDLLQSWSISLHKKAPWQVDRIGHLDRQIEVLSRATLNLIENTNMCKYLKSTLPYMNTSARLIIMSHSPSSTTSIFDLNCNLRLHWVTRQILVLSIQ